MDNFIEVGDGDRGYWWCWICHSCGEIGKAVNPRARDDQKRVHTALGINNLIDNPVDIKERKLVTDTTEDHYVQVRVCEHPDCDIETHAIPAPIGTARDELLPRIPEPVRHAMALEHELLLVREIHKSQLEAMEKKHQLDQRAFHRRVSRVARKYAQAHGWCEEVDNALEEAGVMQHLGAKWVTLQFSVQVDTDQIENQLDINSPQPDDWNEIAPMLQLQARTGRVAICHEEDGDGNLLDNILRLDFSAFGERIHTWTLASVVAVGDGHGPTT